MRSCSRLLTLWITLSCASLAACSSGPSQPTPRDSGDVPGAASRVGHHTYPAVFVSDTDRDAVKEIPPGCEDRGCIVTRVDFIADPSSIALDASGNLYVTSSKLDEIVEVPRGCASVKCATFLEHTNRPRIQDRPRFVAVDESENVFLTNSTFYVKEILARCRPNLCAAVGIGPFVRSSGIAVDGSGTVFVANPADEVVEKLPPKCITPNCAVRIRGGFRDPLGIAVDASGNLFVTDHEANTVKKIPHGCFDASCAVTIGGGFLHPIDVAVDKHGDVFVTEYYPPKLKVVPPGCEAASCVDELGSGFRGLSGIAIAPKDR
jgi:hypothetical protein